MLCGDSHTGRRDGKRNGASSPLTVYGSSVPVTVGGVLTDREAAIRRTRDGVLTVPLSTLNVTVTFVVRPWLKNVLRARAGSPLWSCLGSLQGAHFHLRAAESTAGGNRRKFTFAQPSGALVGS